MQALLDSEEMTDDFCLECRLPSSHTRSLVIENVIISIFPYAPSTNQKDLHKQRQSESLLSNENFLMHASVVSPDNSKHEPPTDGWRAGKKQVVSSFFYPFLTDSTVVPFFQEFLSPSQDILVLSLSFSINHTKNFILRIHLVSHIQTITLLGWMCW